MSVCLTMQYRAQTPDGQNIQGTLEALDANEARQQLVSLGLTVLEMQPVKESFLSMPRRSVTGKDLQLFNQQLINLTQSGLPVEQGLKLIAHDIASRKLKKAVAHVVSELDAGKPLAEAFDSQRKYFPAMYAKIMEVGTRTGRLPGVLFNLGQHLQMASQLKTSLIRACAYPLVIFCFFLLMMGVMSFYVGPEFEKIFEDFDTALPELTVLIMNLIQFSAYILPFVFVILIGSFLSLGMLRLTPFWKWIIDFIMCCVPFLGAVLKRSMIARWCDAVRIGVDASMDLPAAMGLASDLLHSPIIDQDTKKVIACIEEGRPFAAIESLSILPATVLASIELAENAQSLSSSLEDLSSMYRQQADLKSTTLETVLSPMCLIGIAILMGMCCLGFFLPLVKLITNLT